MVSTREEKPAGTRRGWRAAAVALAFAAFAGCGGSQVEKFVPARMTVLGDENSVIEADGRKYTVNGFDTATPPALDCTVNKIWTQIVASVWGFRFPNCASGGVATGRVFAANGAKVADIAAQVTAAGALGETDLVTVFVGQNDILALYAQYTGGNEPALIAQADAAGTALAAQIAAIVRTGAKAVFLSLPELGLTPFAIAEEKATPGRAALLTRLTVAFNEALRTGVSDTKSPSYIDGHQGVQVLVDDLFRNTVSSVLAGNVTTSGYVNVVDPICDPVPVNVLDCNTNTLRTSASNPVLASGGTAINYLWADNVHLSPGGHASLGNVVATRINANPL